MPWHKMEGDVVEGAWGVLVQVIAHEGGLLHQEFFGVVLEKLRPRECW